MSAVLEPKKTVTVSLASSGGLSWATRKLIANTDVAAQKKLAGELAQRPEWSGYTNGHIAFLKAESGHWYVAFSGKAMDEDPAAEIKKILEGASSTAMPFTFVNKVVVHQDFKTLAGLVHATDSDAGVQFGCAEKKLMSFFHTNGFKPVIATMSAFRIAKGGGAGATATWVYPCTSCQHCLVHYWNNLRAS